jgi:hypothetical protein
MPGDPLGLGAQHSYRCVSGCTCASLFPMLGATSAFLAEGTCEEKAGTLVFATVRGQGVRVRGLGSEPWAGHSRNQSLLGLCSSTLLRRACAGGQGEQLSCEATPSQAKARGTYEMKFETCSDGWLPEGGRQFGLDLKCCNIVVLCRSLAEIISRCVSVCA